MEQTKKPLNNFQQRVLAGVIGGAVFIGAIYFSVWSFFLLFLVLTILGQLEFYRLLSEKGYHPQRSVGLLLGVGAYLVGFAAEYGTLATEWLFLMPPIVLLALIAELYRKKELPFVNVAFTLLGVFYVAAPFALLHVLAFQTDQYSWQIVLGVMFLIWSSDSGAYAAGKSFGKHKLFPRISPGKTWEGWAGGLVLAVVVAWGLSFFFQDLSLELWLGMAVLIGIFGVLGDLVESMLKRSLGVKDSGTLIPGHGGILDRFDSLIMVIPFLVAFLELVRL
ncbi:phosphatidate cytidylyltransferase [Rufibacter roseus]|uniref:Phosphatidate cytidylyltransferase n=1 Tax=Rufibacter roseus TaxID=1567108 RepID=A0ABW2DJG5_9BACT|nr:phosphatidate cytidylyltransferase [Rufibacter roseus]